MTRKAHNAVFGSKVLQRDFCKSCQSYAFVLDGKLNCCGTAIEFTATVAKRMSIAVARRTRPGKVLQREILERQGGRCLYCCKEFGSLYFRHGKMGRLRIHWDHMVPYAYINANDGANFAAACNLCNLFKSSLVFQTLDEARIYVKARAESKGVEWV